MKISLLSLITYGLAVDAHAIFQVSMDKALPLPRNGT